MPQTDPVFENIKKVFLPENPTRRAAEGLLLRVWESLLEARGLAEKVGSVEDQLTLLAKVRALGTRYDKVRAKVESTPKAALDDAVQLEKDTTALKGEIKTASETQPQGSGDDVDANAVKTLWAKVEKHVRSAGDDLRLDVLPAAEYCVAQWRFAFEEFENVWLDAEESKKDAKAAHAALLKAVTFATEVIDASDTAFERRRALDAALELLEPRCERLRKVEESGETEEVQPKEVVPALQAFQKAEAAVQSAMRKKEWATAGDALVVLKDAVEKAETALGTAAPKTVPKDLVALSGEEYAEHVALRRAAFRRAAPFLPLVPDMIRRMPKEAKEVNTVYTILTSAASPNVDYATLLQAASDAERFHAAYLELIANQPPKVPLGTSYESLMFDYKALEVRAKRLDAAAKGKDFGAVAEAVKTWNKDGTLAFRSVKSMAADAKKAAGGDDSRVRVRTAEAFDEALRSWKEAIEEFEAALQDAAGSAMKRAEESGDVSQMRAQAAKWGKVVPNALRGLSPDNLDRVASAIGDKVKGDDDKRVLRQAFEARYGVDSLDGDLTSKALPRLYKTFGMVPEGHARTNTLLKSVTRRRPYLVESASWYNEESGKVKLHLAATGIRSVLTFQRGETLDQDSDVPDELKVTGKKVARFDAVTLHEIAHAVDADQKYMERLGGSADHGGWATHSIEEVAAALVAHHNMAADFPSLPVALCHLAVQTALKGEKIDATFKAPPSKVEYAGLSVPNPARLKQSRGLLLAVREAANRSPDETADEYKGVFRQCKDDASLGVDTLTPNDLAVIKLAIGLVYPQDARVALDLDAALALAIRKATTEEQPVVPPQAPVSAIAKHAAVKHATAIRLSGDSGLWEKKDKGAKAYNVGGRVYFEAYKNTWHSYEASARKTGVSSYAWRSPTEWFAEAYSTFFLGKLPKAHALHSYLTEQQKNDA